MSRGDRVAPCHRERAADDGVAAVRNDICSSFVECCYTEHVDNQIQSFEFF